MAKGLRTDTEAIHRAVDCSDAGGSSWSTVRRAARAIARAQPRAGLPTNMTLRKSVVMIRW
jgi:hypothetical protein